MGSASGLPLSPRGTLGGHYRQEVRSAASGTMLQPAQRAAVIAPGQQFGRTIYPPQQPPQQQRYMPVRHPGNLHIPTQGPGPSSR